MVDAHKFDTLVLLPGVAQLYKNKYLRALRHSFFTMMPFLLTVSAFDILCNVIINPQGIFMGANGLNLGFWLTGGLTGEAYLNHWLIKIFSDIRLMSELGYGTVSIIIAAVLSGRLSEIWHVSKEIAVTCTIINLLLLTPLTATESGSLAVFLNGRNFFSAFAAAFFSTFMLSKISRIRRLQIKKPDCFPAALAEHMPMLFPVMLTLTTVVTIVMFLMYLRPVADNLLKSVADMALFQTPLFAAVYQTTVWALWWVGIPGFNFMAILHQHIYMPVAAGNQFNYGTAIFTDGFFTAGIIHLLGLVVAILVFSRHEKWRKAAKLGLPFMLFNVEELFVFGLPIVLNPIFLVPFLLAPLANTLVGWAAIDWGIVPMFQDNLPAVVPPIINGIYGTHSVMGGVLQVVWLIMDIFIYAPFVITANMFSLESEADGAKDGDST